MVKTLLVLTGDAFRHVNGNYHVSEENFTDQKMCSLSHRRFMMRSNATYDVFVNTYDTKNDLYNQSLRSWYADAIRYTIIPEHLGEYGLIDNTIAQLREMDLSSYDNILFVRIDLFLREYFILKYHPGENCIMYAHLDSHESSGNGGPFPGVCHNITFVPSKFFKFLLEGNVWKWHESANIACNYTRDIKFLINSFHSCDTAKEWNPLYAMAGRDEPHIWLQKNIGRRFNYANYTIYKLPDDHEYEYLLNRDTRAQWRRNPESLLTPKKRVVIYSNCQGRGIQGILAYHSALNDEYDFYGANVLSNYTFMNTNAGLPYDILAQADLFIFQPISSDRGKYSTDELLKTLKPSCKAISFVYIYNYSFWETLAFSDGDFDIGTLGMKYALLNHKPITEARESGMTFEQIEASIRNETFDWRFKERYEESQRILREKEANCTIKVADFIDTYHKTQPLFYTHNHPSMFFLRYVSKEIISNLGYNPETLVTEDYLPHPDYNSGRTKGSHYCIGPAAWKYFGLSFVSKPTNDKFDLIVKNARDIYDKKFVDRH